MLQVLVAVENFAVVWLLVQSYVVVVVRQPVAVVVPLLLQAVVAIAAVTVVVVLAMAVRVFHFSIVFEEIDCLVTALRIAFCAVVRTMVATHLAQADPTLLWSNQAAAAAVAAKSSATAIPLMVVRSCQLRNLHLLKVSSFLTAEAVLKAWLSLVAVQPLRHQSFAQTLS